MITTEHIQTAQEFLDKADRYFSEGDELQGSEKMWGAAAHAVMAVAQQRGWNYGDHRSLRVAVRRIAEEQDDPSLELAFGIAEKFHANFYHKFMQDYEFDRDRPAVRLFVQRIHSLMALE
ncbi:MAG: hypothetical protein F4Z28_00985 [Gammaproteobacteria bacterium]|nr:hypothetical protein [Gammaproteobacteria bacterium]